MWCPLLVRSRTAIYLPPIHPPKRRSSGPAVYSQYYSTIAVAGLESTLSITVVELQSTVSIMVVELQSTVSITVVELQSTLSITVVELQSTLSITVVELQSTVSIMVVELQSTLGITVMQLLPEEVNSDVWRWQLHGSSQKTRAEPKLSTRVGCGFVAVHWPGKLVARTTYMLT
ncbi:hypothetical protein JOB18_011303 [Solea senegalensis]|uniref:Uncharacterized protein n=1 Tax=Solea senegalensis TaxID=28829 RepID=A0AAV6QAY5_SOLSE|nr:hypothetical protein JOB18_011303 [Solea senegalensis]